MIDVYMTLCLVMKPGYHFLSRTDRKITKFAFSKMGKGRKIARRSRRDKRVLYALFFDARGMLLQYPDPEVTTVIEN